MTGCWGRGGQRARGPPPACIAGPRAPPCRRRLTRQPQDGLHVATAQAGTQAQPRTAAAQQRAEAAQAGTGAAAPVPSSGAQAIGGHGKAAHVLTLPAARGDMLAERHEPSKGCVVLGGCNRAATALHPKQVHPPHPSPHVRA